MADDLALYRRFPALRRIPRASLCRFPSPVERLEKFSPALWVKRDDLNAPVCGGNKARSLEFLLGGVRPGDTVLTVGGAGSTHVLATAVHAARLGARTVAERWRHDMNPTAELIAAAIDGRCAAPVRVFSPLALVLAATRRIGSRVHYVPLGGSTPLGTLAQVNAGLELAEQIAAGELPVPERIVVPLGSGGTTAGLALGLTVAGLHVVVHGARVAPRIAANRSRVLRLARRTAGLIERITGERLPRVSRRQVHVEHAVFGGAYGRQLPAATDAAKAMRDKHGIVIDATYSAKAFVAALTLVKDGRPTLFWLTFDARCLSPEII